MPTEKEVKTVLLSLGSNIEPRMEYLERAKAALSDRLGPAVKQSSVYETEPWGFTAQGWFLNQLAEYRTHLTAQEILSQCLAIEQELGRVRPQESGEMRYASRTIDIDILLLGKMTIEAPPRLIVPHPRIALRRFILEPLLEMHSEGTHPITGIPWRQLLAECPDQGRVVRIAREEDGGGQALQSA